MEIFESGNAACMFQIQKFESYVLIPCFKRIKWRQTGLLKPGTKRDPCVLWKGDLTAKWQCLEDFPGLFLEKFKPFPIVSLENFCETNLIQIIPFHDLSFSQKTSGWYVLAAKSIFLLEKWTGNYSFETIWLTIAHHKFEKLQDALLIEPIRPQEEAFSNNRSFELSMTFSTSLFYLWKRTKQ